MRLSVGRWLVCVGFEDLVGVLGYVCVLETLNLAVDWYIIWMFSIIGIVGGWLGHKISSKVNQEQLKRGFAVFLVLMGVFILYKNLPSLF